MSPVMSRPAGQVAVAAPHRLATEAGGRAVSRGGNALDAAIAAAAVLAVVYPHQCSIGGDLIALVREPSGEIRATLSVGAAAQQLDVAGIAAGHERMPGRGPLSVTVPGFSAGLAALAGQGALLPLAEAWQYAATLAERGVPVAAGLAAALDANRTVLAADPGAAVLLQSGDTLRQPALAATLAHLAEDPLDLYTGEVAARLAAGLRRLGSPLTGDDLAAHRAELAEPIRHQRGDVSWFVPPPPSQAVALLAVLGARSGLSAAELLDRSLRVASVRDALLADPRVADVPLAEFFAAADTDGSRVPIPARGVPKPAGDTVAVTAVDTDGRAVSIVASVYQSFGAGLLEPDTGIVLHNRGSAFSLDPEHPGRLRPGARPPHTLSPAIAVHTGAAPAVAALGCQGGRAQPWILAQLADAVLSPSAPPEAPPRADDLTALLRRPRWVFGAREIGAAEPTLVVETGSVPADLAAVAAAHGLRTRALGTTWDEAGHVQVALVDDAGARGAADPRADGSALTVPVTGTAAARPATEGKVR